MDPYANIQTEANPFGQVIMMLNAMIPVFCAVGLLAGVILIICKNRWGYYIVFVSLAGLAARMFILR